MQTRPSALCGGAIFAAFCVLTAAHTSGQTGTLADPFAPPSPNAALHYQRALLYLSAVEADSQQLLDQPIWELEASISDDAFSADIKRVLYQGRLAIRSASIDSRFDQCDFGIDFREHGASTPLVHAQPMVRLGRLLTLRGAAEQAAGRWEQAAVVYLDGLRLGRHLTHQPTVIETIAGLEILKNNYYALCRWAVECPQPKMVARARRSLESMGVGITDPSATVASELSILSRRLVALQAAIPNGPWGELILEDLGEEIPEGDVGGDFGGDFGGGDDFGGGGFDDFGGDFDFD